MRILWFLFLIGIAVGLCAEPVKLRLATLENPPFIVREGGEAQGETVRVVRALLDKLGLDATMEFFPAARGVQVVLTGECDGFFTLKHNPERDKTLLFMNEPLIVHEYVFFCQKDQKLAFDGSFESIKGASIGVVNATSYGTRFDTAVRNGELTNLDAGSSTFAQNFQKLAAGRIDFVISSKATGLALLKELGLADKLRINGPVIGTSSSYLAFTKVRDYSDLAARMDKLLVQFKKDGTWERLKEPPVTPR